MPSFRYTAVTRSGTPERGQVDAASKEAAMADLMASGLLPSKLEPVSGALTGQGRWAARASGGRMSRRDLELFAREVGRLLSAGAPLDRALDILAEVAPGGALGSVAAGLSQKVRAGASLSAAMAETGPPFDQMTITLVEGGETAGALPEVLARMAVSMSRTRELTSAVRSALIYPLLLLIVAVLAVVGLLVFVVPQFETMVASSSAGPGTGAGATGFIFAVSDFLRAHGVTLLVGGALMAIAVPVLGRQPAIRSAAGRLAEAVPGLGGLLVKLRAARLCRACGTLLQNGVQLLAAMKTLRSGASAPHIAGPLAATVRDLEGGTPFAVALGIHATVPPLAVRMVAIGEETGQLPAMLLDIAEIYEEDVRTGFQQLVTLLEPILILALGLVIGGIVVSILGGIMGASDFVG